MFHEFACLPMPHESFYIKTESKLIHFCKQMKIVSAASPSMMHRTTSVRYTAKVEKKKGDKKEDNIWISSEAMTNTCLIKES